MLLNKTLVIRFSFFFFWCIFATIFFIRIFFDLKTFIYGSTVVFQVSEPGDYEYILHLPPGYSDLDNQRPLIVFLHGSGEINKGAEILKKCDLWHYARGAVDSRKFPFIVISPMAPEDGWDTERLAHFVKKISNDHTKRYSFDSQRIYLTGFSMGGFATFSSGNTHHELYAAIVPLAGGGNSENMNGLKTIPTWAFHGDADTATSIDCSTAMLEAMKAKGNSNAHLTVLHGAGHGIPNQVYSRPELYHWLLQQRQNKQP